MLLWQVALLLSFFAVTMGVNYGEDKNYKPAGQQNNEDGLIPPDFADKLGQIGIHAARDHTTFPAKVNTVPDASP
jgi:hypothetical protein